MKFNPKPDFWEIICVEDGSLHYKEDYLEIELQGTAYCLAKGFHEDKHWEAVIIRTDYAELLRRDGEGDENRAIQFLYESVSFLLEFVEEKGLKAEASEEFKSRAGSVHRNKGERHAL